MKKVLYLIAYQMIVLYVSACSLTTSVDSAPSIVKRGQTDQDFNSSSSGTLHAIIVADTLNLGFDWLPRDPKSIRTDIGTTEDSKLIREFVNNVQKATGLRLSVKTIDDSGFNDKNVINAINNIVAKPDDIIFFYYTGHGINRGQHRNQKLPNLVLSGIESDQLSLDSIASTILSKNARLSIVLADACNNFIPTGSAKGMDTLEQVDFNSDGYQKLFAVRGSIVGTASEMGQTASGEDKKGGYFTRHFLREFNEAASTNPNWMVLEKKITQRVKVERGGTLQEVNPEQKPILSVNLDNKPLAKLSVHIRPTIIPLGYPITVTLTNETSSPRYLFAWDVNSDGKVSNVANGVRIESSTTNTMASKAIEPRGESRLVAVLHTTSSLSIMVTEYQQLLSQLKQYGLTPVVEKYIVE